MYRQKFNVLTPSLSFRIFHKAFLQKDKGIVTSCFLVCASHIQLMIFIFQVFLRLFPTTNALIGYVDTVTQYFYLFNILYINKTLYSFLRVFAWILSLSYMILYLAMRFIYFKEKRAKTLEKIFTLFNTFYAMVFLLPCLEVLIKDIICDSAVLQQFGHECLQKEHVVIFLFSLISTFACLFMSFLSIFFSQNGMYDKTNCLSGENRGYDFLISSIKVLLVSTSIILEDSPGFKHAYFSLNLVYSIILFCSFLIYFPYNKRIIEMLCISWLAVYLAHSLGTLISSVSEDPDFMASFPFVGFAVLIITFAILAYQQSKFRLIIKEQVSSTRELVRKVQQIFQLKHSHELNSNGEICFRGIISRHLDTCIESDCFCKQMELYDPKKERTLDLEKWTTSKSVVLKYYARLLFEQQLKKTPLDTDLLISYANFLFQKFHNTHLSLYQLMIVTNHKVYLYPRQRQKIFKLRHQISEYIDAKNADALEVAMEIENVLSVEDQFTKVLETMKEIIQKSLNFWKYLAEKELNMKEIHRLAKELSNTVDATIQLWSPLKPYLQKYKKLMYYYNWFLKEFLIKKTIVSEEQVDDLFDDDMYSVHSNDFIHILKNDHILFNDDTPVIHISGNPMDLGRIIKLNRATMKVFGYTKEELLKSNVSKLMPKIIGDKHTSYLEAHTKTGKAKVLYEQRKVFGRNREGYVFPMWLIVKQFNNLQGLVEYVGLIRPMSEKKEDPHEYILLNEYGEVGGITKNLVPLLGIKEEKLHKKSFNIAMLAPKLIQFLTLRQFLQEFDPEREKQKIKEENNRNKMQIIGDDIVSPRKVNSPDTPETGGFSSAYKFAQSVDDQKNFTPDPDTLISVWKEPKENTSHISPLGTGTRNIDIREFLELDLYDEVKEVECPEPEKDILMEKQVEKEVEFTLRIPRNFDEYVKEFEAIKARQRLSLHVQQQFVDIVQMNLMSNRSQIDTTRNLNILSHRSQIESTRNLLDKGNVGKKMVQQHFINSDAYLNALKTTATKIAKSHTSRIYRISGTVGIDTYGPEGDKLKYIKITEVKLYEEKKAGFSSSSVSLSTFNYLPKKEGKSSEFSVDGPVTPAEMGESRSHRDSRARPYKLSIFSGLKSEYEAKLRKISIDDGGDLDNVSDFLEEVESQKDEKETNVKFAIFKKKNMDSKSDKESKSSKDEEKSNASNDSAKIELFDELKNTIINQYQSIYFKDDNQIIHKKFENLNKLKFFLQLFFVILSPLVVIIYFATMHQTIHMVGDSANNINSNERLRKNFLRVTDAIVTLLLNDGGFYNNITLVDSSEVDQLMDHEINIIDSLYENILEMNKQDEWINVLYRYVPEKERQITVNYGGKFSAMTITMEQLIQKLINDFSAITLMNKEEFIRGNSLFTLFRTTSFHTFDQVLREVSLDFFTNAIDSFYSSRSAFLWFVLGNLLALAAGLALMYRLAFRVLKSLKQILFSFTFISFQTVKQTEEYYKQLMRLFTASTLQYIDGKHAKDLFKELSLQNAKPNPSELKFAKKNKRIIDKDFMKKNTTRIFSFFITGVLIYTILNVGLFLYINASISYSTNVLSDGKELVKLDTVYIASLIGLKLLFLDQALYEEVALPYLTQSLDLLNTTLSSTVFKGDCVFSDYAREILEGRVCEIFRPLFKTADQIEDCGTLAQGKLSTGLATFHSYYSNLVLFPLNLEGERFGEVNIDSIYEFGQLIQIIDEVIMNRGLDLWKTDVKDFLSTENRLMTIFVIVLCVFNMLMFLIVERTIVKNLHTRFLFYRKVYNRYMLTESLFKEKLIKAGLVKYQLVNR